MRQSILVSLLTEEQEFQRLQASEAQAAANRVSADVKVIFAQNNLVQQIHELLVYIHLPQDKRPAAVVVEPISADALEQAATAAAEAGIGWISLGCHPPYIDELRAKHPQIPIAAVAVDNEKIGEMQAEQFERLLPSGGDILCVKGPLSSPSSSGRQRGMEQRLRTSNVRVMKMLTADWTEDGAERVVKSWLMRTIPEGLRPDLVGAQNDSMAVGARRAFLDLEVDCSMPFTGCDGLPGGGQQLVNDKILAATIVKSPEAGVAVELVVRASQGEVIPAHVPMPVEFYPDIYK